MRCTLTTLLALALPLGGCGFTFGVDAIERVTDVEADAGDAVELAILDIGVDDEVVVCGGGASVAAHVSTVQWSGGGDDTDAIGAELVRVGDALELKLSGASEAVTLKRIDADIPDALGIRAEIPTGTLTVCDLAAPVTAVVDDGVTLRDIAAPASVTARSVSVEYSIPIELVTSGSVNGTLAEGGTITAPGTTTLSLEDDDFDTLEVTSDGTSDGDFVEIFLPPGGAWSIYIESASGTGFIDSGDFFYHSIEEDAPPVADGIEVDVNGGGAQIRVVTDAANIFVRDTGR